MFGPPPCCRTPKAVQGEKVACPSCGFPGTSVMPPTLRAMLRPELKAQVLDAPYCFCTTPACTVVYFLPGGPQTFNRDDLTVRVGIKETDPPHPVCYCFDHTIESLRAEVERTGGSSAVGAIQSAVKAGTCRCEVTNPSGRCCLRDVVRVLKEIIRPAETGEVVPWSQAHAPVRPLR